MGETRVIKTVINRGALINRGHHVGREVSKIIN